MKDLYTAITDYASYPQFVTGMKDARVEEGPQGRKVHFDLELMKRLQYSVLIESKLDEAAGTARVWWKLDRSEFFKANNGSWELKALGPSKTEVTYKLDLDFAFPVPGFILKNLVKGSLPSAIRDFGERARLVARKGGGHG